jgi:lipopolysaccharide export system ATP-binding protein
MEAGLNIQNVSKSFDRTPVLKGVSLMVPPGRVTALLGPNGAGKTTLFRAVMGLLRPEQGTVTLEGRDILSLPLHKKAAAGMGWLPQECASFDELSVRENMLALLEIMPLSRAERRERLERLLGLLGLGPVADRRYALLSGGERRRLEIAKTLASDPRALLLDEPFSGIDPPAAEEIAAIVKKLAGRGMAVLLTDHNIPMTFAFAEYVYLLVAGEIICEGKPGEMAQNERARSSYLGHALDFAGAARSAKT